MKRLQIDRIVKDLEKKIVFLVGPRQVGKTWLAKEIASHYKYSVYLNWDHASDREIITSESWLDTTELLVLDELHKMPNWKNYLKGLFDTKLKHLKIMVTGSARLDILRQSGDSLAGRFFTHRLMPLSLKECELTEYKNDIGRFVERGGFPEPFLAENVAEAKRWRQQYTDGLTKIDVLDLEAIHGFRSIQLVLDLLQRRVGVPISFTSIAGDVGISPSTVLKYVQILEALYIIFRITPFSHNIARSLLKEPKIYFYDNGMVVGDSGARFENFMAISLLKHVYGCSDYLGDDFSLQYMRTKDGVEADFCIVKNNVVDTVVEAKVSDSKTSSGLAYFCNKYSLRGIQVVQNLKQERKDGVVQIRKALEYCKELFL